MRATLLLLIGLLVIHPIAVSASILGSVSQYSTPSGNWQARSMTVGPDGNVWSAATNARKIAKTTSLGVTTEYTLPTGYKTPQNIINGPYGSLWFSAFKQNVNTYSNTYSIGKISTNGVMSFYDLPIPSDRTTYFSSVMSIDVVDGIVWVVREYSKYVQKLTINGAASSVALLKLDKPDEVPAASYNSTNALYVAQSLRYNPKDGYVYIFSKERDNSNSTLGHYVERYSQSGDHNIYSLGYTMSDFYMVSKVVVDMSGRLWFLGGSSSTGNEIGYLDPQTDTTNLYSMPNNDYFVGSITVGADGNIWATERNTVNSGANGKVASLNIDTGAIDEYNLPSDSQYPYGIVASIDNNLWISHYGVNKIQKFGIGDISGFIDNDSDNLALQDELKQGTSDYSPDTDNDGITDYVESPNYTGRNNLFCNTSITNCEYPDPLTRDIYVEVD